MLTAYFQVSHNAGFAFDVCVFQIPLSIYLQCLVGNDYSFPEVHLYKMKAELEKPDTL